MILDLVKLLIDSEEEVIYYLWVFAMRVFVSKYFGLDNPPTSGVMDALSQISALFRRASTRLVCFSSSSPSPKFSSCKGISWPTSVEDPQQYFPPMTLQQVSVDHGCIWKVGLVPLGLYLL